MFKRCTRCKLIWVCWNWVYYKNNWSHECWNCANCWATKEEITWGIPYFILKLLSNYFIEEGRFERQLAEDNAKIFAETLNEK